MITGARSPSHKYSAQAVFQQTIVESKSDQSWESSTLRDRLRQKKNPLVETNGLKILVGLCARQKAPGARFDVEHGRTTEGFIPEEKSTSA